MVSLSFVLVKCSCSYRELLVICISLSVQCLLLSLVVPTFLELQLGQLGEPASVQNPGWLRLAIAPHWREDAFPTPLALVSSPGALPQEQLLALVWEWPILRHGPSYAMCWVDIDDDHHWPMQLEMLCSYRPFTPWSSTQWGKAKL